MQKAAGWSAEGQGAQIDLLVSLLTERIEDPNIPEEEKGRLRRVRDAIGGVGRDVFTEILAAYLARASPAPAELEATRGQRKPPNRHALGAALEARSASVERPNAPGRTPNAGNGTEGQRFESSRARSSLAWASRGCADLRAPRDHHQQWFTQ